MLDLAGLRNPIWRTDDRLRDPAVLPVQNGYLVFYSRFSANRAWLDPHAWAVACACTSNFRTFAHDHDVTAKGFASPGDAVCWGGRWVLPYQSYPTNPTHLCFSESSDLHTWTAPTFVLSEANELPWNTCQRAIDPTFVVDGEVLHCFFVGSCATDTPDHHINMVGHAVSTDPGLQRWCIITRDAPLIGRSQGAHTDASANNVTVFRTGEGWTLIYSEGVADQHLAWARSPDLLRWEFQGALPLPAQRWMSRKHGAPFVWREGDGYMMILMGTDAADWTTFGLLTSRDGVHWAPLPEQ
jgi:hypothetical protein